jgi:hypothetical protein
LTNAIAHGGGGDTEFGCGLFETLQARRRFENTQRIQRQALLFVIQARDSTRYKYKKLYPCGLN